MSASQFRSLRIEILKLAILSRLKFFRHLAGQKPSQRLSRQRLLSLHKEITPPYTVSHEYPPSIAPVSTLQKKFINDLLLETNHRGSYLLVRTITYPRNANPLVSVIEDENDGCEIFEFHNMCSNGNGRLSEILPNGQILLIKEPFFKMDLNGRTCVCVDHISDVIYLNPEDDRVPAKWRSRDGSPLSIPRYFLGLFSSGPRSAAGWKKEGEKLFRQGRFQEAIERYTKGIGTAEAEDYSTTALLQLDRAQALLEGGLYDRALEDANKLLRIQPKNERGLYYQAKALYQARRFDDCKESLDRLSQYHPASKEAKEELLKVGRRLEEQKGKYDFKEMITNSLNVSPETIDLDYADFVGPVQLKPTRSAGRGMFTTQDVKAGELLFCSKAFQISYTESADFLSKLYVDLELEEVRFHENTSTDLVQKLYKNPSQMEKFLELYSGGYPKPKERFVDGQPVVDSFLISNIQRLNSSEHQPYKSPRDWPTERDVSKRGVAVYISSSFVNHWCLPTARCAFIGDMQILRAARDLKKGEEITISYRSRVRGLKKRRESLMEVWRFLCKCPLCLMEEDEPPTIQEKRQTLLDEMELLGSTNSWESLQRALEIIKSLEATYKTPPTTQPRIILAYCLYVVGLKCFRERQLAQHRKGIAIMLLYFEALGYRLKIDEVRGQAVIQSHGVMMPETLMACHILSRAFASVGDISRATAVRELTAFFFEIRTGTKTNFEEFEARAPNRFQMLREVWKHRHRWW